MKRDMALRVLARHYPDGIVVAVYQTAFEWMKIRPHPLNYLCTGAMGQASSHGLGLALGAPGEKIVVLDGDGSLLMNLGSLVTIANSAPPNLIHFVSHNGRYEVNGDFPIPTDSSFKFHKLAIAAGYKNVFSFSDIDQFEIEIKQILAATGPVFVELHVEPGGSFPRNYDFIHSEECRSTFRKALHKRVFNRFAKEIN